jgi:predicted nucleic acid-binding protein
MALRVVLDTSVVVAGLRSRLGGANAMLRLVAQKRIIALATPPLFLEYEEVLRRPELDLLMGWSPIKLTCFSRNYLR